MSLAEIPTASTLPVLQLLQWLNNPGRLLERERTRLGGIFRLRIAGWANLVIVADPDLAGLALADRPGEFETGAANALMSEFVGDRSIFVTDGADHRALRRAMAPLFATSARADLTTDLQAIIQDALAAAAGRAGFSAEVVLRRVACRVAWRAISGRDHPFAGDLAEPLSAALGARAALAAFAGDPVRSWVVRPVRRALEVIETAIFEEIDRQASGRAPAGGIVGILLRDRDPGCPEARRHVRDNAISLLAAGADTTASAGAWTTVLALEEDNPFRGRIDQAAAEGDLGYLRAVVDEALRLGPVVEVVSRRAAKATSIGAYAVRPGDLVSACPYLIHRDPVLYPDPHRFDPSRFLEPDRPPGHYLPFGGGARGCLGGAVARSILIAWICALQTSPFKADARRRSPIRRRNVTLGPACGGRLTRRRPVGDAR